MVSHLSLLPARCFPLPRLPRAGSGILRTWFSYLCLLPPFAAQNGAFPPSLVESLPPGGTYMASTAQDLLSYCVPSAVPQAAWRAGSCRGFATASLFLLSCIDVAVKHSRTNSTVIIKDMNLKTKHMKSKSEELIVHSEVDASTKNSEITYSESIVSHDPRTQIVSSEGFYSIFSFVACVLLFWVKLNFVPSLPPLSSAAAAVYIAAACCCLACMLQATAAAAC